MKRHTRVHVKFHWLRVARKRQRFYREVWPDSREYVESLSLNEHAVNNLGTRCSCEMCSPGKMDTSRRQRERREWQRHEATA